MQKVKPCHTPNYQNQINNLHFCFVKFLVDIKPEDLAQYTNKRQYHKITYQQFVF